MNTDLLLTLLRSVPPGVTVLIVLDAGAVQAHGTAPEVLEALRKELKNLTEAVASIDRKVSQNGL